MSAKRQQRTVGAIVKIPLDDGWHTYAQILPEADCSVFEARTEKELTVSEVVSRPVLFRVAVYRHAFTRGRWPKVGTAPLRMSSQSPFRSVHAGYSATDEFFYLPGWRDSPRFPRRVCWT
jgi:hypothetical protein